MRLTNPAASGESQSVLDLTTRGLSCRFQKITDGPDSSAILDLAVAARAVSILGAPFSLDQADVPLKNIGDTAKIGGKENAVLRVHVSGFLIEMRKKHQQRHFQAKTGSVDMQFLTPAGALVLGMARIWRTAFGTAQAKMHRRSSTAMLLYRIVQGAIAMGTTADQPPFVYESSYSLHVEDQRNIRRDPGWLLLARLRHWYRLGIPDLPIDILSGRKIGDFVVSQLAKYEDTIGGNDDLVRRQQFIKETFGHDIEPVLPDSLDARNENLDIFVIFDALSLCHFGRLLESGETAPSSMTIASASLGMQRSAVIRNQRPLTQNRIFTALRSIDVEIRSGAFSPFQSLLMHLNDDFNEEPAFESYAQKEAEQASIYIFDGHLKQASVSVLASGLRIRFGVSGTHISVSQEKARGNGGIDAQILAQTAGTMSLDAIELAMLQPLDEHDLITHSVDRVLVSIRAAGLCLVFDSHGSTKTSTTLRLLVGLNTLNFDSRPQLRAFCFFVRDWQDRHFQYVQLEFRSG